MARCAAIVVAALTLALPASAAASCAVADRPLLCRSYAVLHRAERPSDRLPALVRDDPPFKHGVVSRRLRVGPPRVFVAVGRRLVCVVIAHRGSAGVGCGRGRSAARGVGWLEEPCGGPRQHRLIHVQLLPDGVASATVRRRARPPVTFAVRNNVLVARLHVPSPDYQPTRIDWRLRGRAHTTRLAGSHSCG